MKRIAIYPGSFDPVTNGHLDLVRRAAKIFDEVIVAVTDHGQKRSLFSIEDRVKMFRTATRGWPKVAVESFRGLLVDYSKKRNACAVIRGLRAVSDFEYEFQMALMNRHMSQKKGNPIEIVYMMPDERYTYISSTLVKEVSRLGGEVRRFVPYHVQRELTAKWGLTNRPFSVRRLREKSPHAEIRL